MTADQWAVLEKQHTSCRPVPNSILACSTLQIAGGVIRPRIAAGRGGFELELRASPNCLCPTQYEPSQ